MKREQLKVDVLFVGAGPANLSAALHLSRLIQKHNTAVENGTKVGSKLDNLTLLVIEKGREIGSHTLSGAVVDPRGFDELLEGLGTTLPPYDSPVDRDALYILTKRQAFRSPFTPTPLQNHGYFLASLGKIVKWMASLCKDQGIEVYPEFPAVKLLYNDDFVLGARIGDKGLDQKGNPKKNFDPGIDVLSKITVLGEGSRGTLTRQAERRLKLDQQHSPQIYSVGIKEVWKVPKNVSPGAVYHTLGFPLGTSEFGGGFVYIMKDNLIDLGYVVGLDYENPFLNPHQLFQQFKTHPFIREMLQGGEILSYGAKAIPEGGYYSMPRPWADGLLIVGDSAGFLNSQRLKGIHLAVKSGILAAETILEAFLKNDFSSVTLKNYSNHFESSWAKNELWKVRNFRQSFQKGVWSGLLHSAFQLITNGRGLRDPMPTIAGHTRMKRLTQHVSVNAKKEIPLSDTQLTFDRLTAVYFSDTAHEEDQPCHLKILDHDICHNRCTREYGNPCQYFCPAKVYEITQEDNNENHLQINFSNCVHCKTCEIMDPYQIVVWTPPEGGGGPNYKNM